MGDLVKDELGNDSDAKSLTMEYGRRQQCASTLSAHQDAKAIEEGGAMVDDSGDAWRAGLSEKFDQQRRAFEGGLGSKES